VLDEVPEAHREAAEEIRAHLVALRGGAPFLSSADARLLVGWLDEAVPVPAILRALERAADARRKRRSRIPLSLGHARRHLGKPTRGALPAGPADPTHPLAPLAVALRAQAAADPREESLRALADALLELEGEADGVVRGALALIRGFFADAWSALTEAERAVRLAAAREEIADLADLVDEAVLVAAVEEVARDRLRQGYPLLTAATVWDLVEVP